MNSWESRIGKLLQAWSLDSLRKKIIVFAVGAALIPSLFTATIFYRQNQRSLTTRLTEDLQGASLQGARIVDVWLKGALAELRHFANSQEVTGRSRPTSRLGGYLTSLQQKIPIYRGLAVLDPAGNVLATTGHGAGTAGLPADWRRRLAPGVALVGEPTVDSGGATITLAVAIATPTAQLSGTLVAEVEVRDLTVQLTQVPRRSGSRLSLLTEQGTTPLTLDSTRQALPDPPYPEEALAALGDSGQFTTFRGPDGTERVGAATRVPGTSWLLLAELPSGQAYRQIARMRNLSLGFILSMLGIVGVLAYLLGQLIVRPLDRLIAASKKVAGGDLAVDLPITTGGEVGALTEVFNTMVARLRDHRQELERLSITDALTGLFNRRHFGAVLATECERARRHGHFTSLLLIDIDHFKSYNDTYGHLAGDEVLRRVAQLIQETVRTVDCVARYGGEEFVVVLPETALEGAMLLGERLRRRISMEAFHGRMVTLSIGVAQTPAAGGTPEAIIASADDALYRAKREGRDRVRA